MAGGVARARVCLLVLVHCRISRGPRHGEFVTCGNVDYFHAEARDSVTISVEAVVYYRVSDPIAAKNNVEDYRINTVTLGRAAGQAGGGLGCTAPPVARRRAPLGRH
ncbi:Protein unc-1 [Portunus trituberculatus]|uniref:Protein unc-1 n=1 Tax=Portunus trituberculatus TaxID=210409 RepID=A0A5B7DH43_PORTR|nr:Protein unc-1 [Portunus trituberculatus]